MAEPNPQMPPDENAPSFESRKKQAYYNDPEYRRRQMKVRRFLDILFKVSLTVLGIVVIGGIAFGFYLAKGLPSLQQLENPKPELATEVYSADGVLLTKFFMKNRTVVPLDSISNHVRNALIATEDVGFYDHWGFDTRRTLTALAGNIFRRSARGASTITQQLARNLYLSPERTLVRKIRELITAVQIEHTYTKDEILALYLNTVYFGSGSYGVEAASWTYFGHPASELTVDEAAVLVGILKNPKKYNPSDNPKDAVSRRNTVLELMAKNNVITEADAAKYKAKPITLRYTPVTDPGTAPYFTEHIRQLLQRKAEKYKFDQYRDGLIITTTLDTRMQAHAEAAVNEHIKWVQSEFDKAWKWTEPRKNEILETTNRYLDLVRKGTPAKQALAKVKQDKVWTDSLFKELGTVQVGFVAIEPQTGHVKAWVGGRDFDRYKFDHVFQATRQPGSTFKPFVYTAAIDNGVPPNRQFLNQPISVPMGDGKLWTPGNAEEGELGGMTTLRDALKLSLNIVTARLMLESVPPRLIATYAKKLGINSKLDPVYALCLGTSDVTPLELTSAYGTFANEGVHVEPFTILRIENQYGEVLENNTPDRREALEKASNYVMVSMLKSVMESGTGASARGAKFRFLEEAGGKTGTTQAHSDAWFVGFTPDLVAGCWTGFDDRRVHYTSMSYGQGARAALPIWATFMKSVYSDPAIMSDKNLRIAKGKFFAKPDGVTGVLIDRDTNQPATSESKNVYTEYFTRKGLNNLSLQAPPDSTGRVNLQQPKNEPKHGEGQF
jgi:penicillin-binding protein 1A